MLNRINARIARRILVNFRAHPDVVRAHIPAPFTPQLVNGYAVLGVCLIRLEQARPPFLPAAFGCASENMAHRVAVLESDTAGAPPAVYIWRRDTGSRLLSVASGRLLRAAGPHALARFSVTDTAPAITLRASTPDGAADVELSVRRGPWRPTQLFASLEQASAFFQAGACGYTGPCDNLTALRLETNGWRMSPLIVEHVRARFFERLLPADSWRFDSAFLMEDLESSWLAVTREIRERDDNAGFGWRN